MDNPLLYAVEYSEPAEIELEAEHSRLADIVSEEFADRWQDGLLAEINRLALFPTCHDVAPENDLYDVEVRRLLYHGPTRRRGKPTYRILFYIIEPTPEDHGIVRVLHVWHGAQRPRW